MNDIGLVKFVDTLDDLLDDVDDFDDRDLLGSKFGFESFGDVLHEDLVDVGGLPVWEKAVGIGDPLDDLKFFGEFLI